MTPPDLNTASGTVSVLEPITSNVGGISPHTAHIAVGFNEHGATPSFEIMVPPPLFLVGFVYLLIACAKRTLQEHMSREFF